MLIKVCGMRVPDNIREVASLGINWMGFIFYARSPRFVANVFLPLSDQEQEAVNYKKVGVFVNATTEEMMETASRYRLDYLQLHGSETPDDCYVLQKRGYSLIKAFQVATEEDLAYTADYEGRVDYFLFDTKSAGYGGSGEQFDWSVLSAYEGKTPFLLSGGICQESAEAVKSMNHPCFVGIDLNSGFELEPGLKDCKKLKKFIKEIRNN